MLPTPPVIRPRNGSLDAAFPPHDASTFQSSPSQDNAGKPPLSLLGKEVPNSSLVNGINSASNGVGRDETSESRVPSGESPGSSKTPATTRRIPSTASSPGHSKLARYASSPSSPSPPEVPPKYQPIDPHEATLMRSARAKMSSRDQEAMLKLRATQKLRTLKTEHFDSSSLKSPNAVRPVITSGPQASPTESRLRRSMSSKESPQRTEREGQGRPKANGTSQSGISPSLRNGRSSPASSYRSFERPQTPPRIRADFVMAVVGHEGVGKTTVITNALKAWGTTTPVNLRHPEGFNSEIQLVTNLRPLISVVSSYSSHILAGGKLKVAHKIDLMEMNMAAFKLVRDFRDFWIPVVPAISGVILCYDSGRPETLVGFDEALRKH